MSLGLCLAVAPQGRATFAGAVGVYLIDERQPDALTYVWLVSTVWISIRAFFGVTRIWPGIGRSPLSHSVSEAAETGRQIIFYYENTS